MNDKINNDSNKQSFPNTENLDTNVTDVNNIQSDKKSKLKSEFKVLGTTDFEKKTQVSFAFIYPHIVLRCEPTITWLNSNVL